MVRVFLDGEEVTRAVEADDELGFVVVLTEGPGARLKLLTGAVVVVFDENPPRATDGRASEVASTGEADA